MFQTYALAIIHYDMLSMLRILKFTFHLTVCFAIHLISTAFEEVQAFMEADPQPIDKLNYMPQQLKKSEWLKS